MQWLVATGIAAVFAAIGAVIIARVKRPGRRSGRLAGVSLALGMAFWGFFEPATVEATEQIEQRKALGDIEAGVDGDPVE